MGHCDLIAPIFSQSIHLFRLPIYLCLFILLHFLIREVYKIFVPVTNLLEVITFLRYAFSFALTVESVCH